LFQEEFTTTIRKFASVLVLSISDWIKLFNLLGIELFVAIYSLQKSLTILKYYCQLLVLGSGINIILVLSNITN